MGDELHPPFNLLMPFRGHRLVVEYHGHTTGDLPARVGEAGDLKMIPTVRMQTRRVDKESDRFHVDITRAQPAAMLSGFLRLGQLWGKEIEFRARGKGPSCRDTIHIKPK